MVLHVLESGITSPRIIRTRWYYMSRIMESRRGFVSSTIFLFLPLYLLYFGNDKCTVDNTSIQRTYADFLQQLFEL